MKKLLFVFLLFPIISFSQTDSLTQITGKKKEVVQEEGHLPKKAALYAAVLPGLGHIYNKKYWKLPLVYGAVGTSVGFIIYNTSLYNDYFTALKARLDDDLSNDDLYFPGVPTSAIETETYRIRTWVEWSYIALLGSYLLQIVDATVDAHFFDFNVSDDLSMAIRPSLQTTPSRNLAQGITLSLTF